MHEIVQNSHATNLDNYDLKKYSVLTDTLKEKADRKETALSSGAKRMYSDIRDGLNTAGGAEGVETGKPNKR
jgi:hypothetical protein